MENHISAPKYNCILHSLQIGLCYTELLCYGPIQQVGRSCIKCSIIVTIIYYSPWQFITGPVLNMCRHNNYKNVFRLILLKSNATIIELWCIYIKLEKYSTYRVQYWLVPSDERVSYIVQSTNVTVTKFEMSTFVRSRDRKGSQILKSRSRAPDHVHFGSILNSRSRAPDHIHFGSKLSSID